MTHVCLLICSATTVFYDSTKMLVNFINKNDSSDFDDTLSPKLCQLLETYLKWFSVVKDKIMMMMMAMMLVFLYNSWKFTQSVDELYEDRRFLLFSFLSPLMRFITLFEILRPFPPNEWPSTPAQFQMDYTPTLIFYS